MDEDIKKELILSKLDYLARDVRELKHATIHNVVNDKDWRDVITSIIEIERDIKEY